MPSEKKPDPSQAATGEPEQERKYSEMSEDELDTLLVQQAVGEPEQPEPVEPEPEPAAAQDAQESAEAQQEEPAKETEPDAVTTEPATEPEGAPTEAEPEKPPSPDQLMLQQMKLEQQRLRAERDRLSVLSGRHAGELGHVKKVLEQLQSAPAPQAQQDEFEPQRTQPTGDPRVETLQGRLQELETTARGQAVQTVYQEFLGQHADADIQKMAPSLEREIEPYREIIQTGSIKSVRSVVMSLLQTAYADQKMAELEEQMKAASTKQAEQVPQRKTAKVQAAISGSGSRPAPKERQKTYQDMTADELDKELQRKYAHLYRPRLRG